ncbi:MAG: Maebl [Verrucomicrobia bacterium 61-8]|nr:NYN domain-containing protein [Verrucomicrobiota bacterium]OJV02141.1 MAG: Maebl [Verrucomicrobia bacterium 61-8]
MSIPSGSEKLAVLIDADNAQASLVNEMLSEISRYGTATIKRAYGDWTTPQLSGWKSVLHQQAIQPVQQFQNTKGKNSSDSALIIDAMDILHSGNVEGFCLVSSDSDFTRLATRIRESGYVVYGLGQEKTPDSFVNACDKFIFTEILNQQASSETRSSRSATQLEQMLRDAINATARENGWSTLSAVGVSVQKSHPSFDSRNYGCSKLSELVRKQPYIEMRDERMSGENTSATMYYVRLKKGAEKTA